MNVFRRVLSLIEYNTMLHPLTCDVSFGFYHHMNQVFILLVFAGLLICLFQLRDYENEYGISNNYRRTTEVRGLDLFLNKSGISNQDH